MKSNTLLLWICIAGIGAAAAAAPPSPSPEAPLRLEQIMADPDWIGAPVRDAYWAADGGAVYYSLKSRGSPIVELHRIDLGEGKDRVLDGTAMAEADGPPVYDRGARHAAFIRNGDVFIRELPHGRLLQVTRSEQPMSAPRFDDNGLLTFRAGNEWFIHDLATGLTATAAVLKTEKDPDAQPKPDDLRDMQLRTFATLRRLHEESKLGARRAAQLRSADKSRIAAPFYLGEDVLIKDTELSPDGRWMLVVTTQKSAEAGFKGKLTRYVTESGYEEFETERTRVGRNRPAAQSLLLLDLRTHGMHPLPLEDLPGIHDDPLKSVRQENAARNTAAPSAASAPAAAPARRDLLVASEEPDPTAGGTAWSGDGTQLAIEILALDNKDRWIATVDFSKFSLVTQHRLTDPAWVNWSFNEFGWLKDNRTLWFLSEQSGYAHLYIKPLQGGERALTAGRFEVSEPVLSSDGRWFYCLSNAAAPYAQDVYRVAVVGGRLERVTQLEGVESFMVDRSGHGLLITHSSPYVNSQLALVREGARPRELTDTRTAEYKALTWLEPEIIQVPSRHFDGVVYGKLYRGDARGNGAHPGVLFIHGAGYLQDVHRRFPYYFREQMFNNLLAQQGYVVLDLDYRASAGYGRDWRTAIYRQMGHPELEDLLDGKAWLVEHAKVDPQRVGLYGGSYGGFMTLMGLFRAPGEFAAGAALRPVTDWMQYDHNYTAAILNEPQIDPLSYERSSPINFAEGLRDPLLIAHGVIDDNVLFADSMRLYERLIELHKDGFSLSPYPLDRHGFTNADSWLDEYKRIFSLFDSYLQKRP